MTDRQRRCAGSRLIGLLWGAEAAIGFARAEPWSLTVVDADTRQPLPARVHLSDPSRQPVRAPGLPYWHDHFVCTGAVTIALGPGTYRWTVERGPEYTAAEGNVALPGAHATNQVAALRRLADPSREGWWSGETHVHRAPADVPLLLRAEDLHVAQVITWWNKDNPWTSTPLPETLPVRLDGDRFFHPLGGEDERDGGALLYFGLTKPLNITGGRQHYPSSVVFARQARAQGAVWLDAEKPFWWDVPMWIALGAADTVGIAHNHMHRGGVYPDEAWGRPRDRDRYPDPQGNGRYSQDIYYHVLNAGVRLPPSAGSASGVLPNPVGYNRAYVHVDGELTAEKWIEGLRAGRSFVSNGPLLRCRANGQFPGHVFSSGHPLEILIEGRLDSRDPIAAVELVRDGSVERIELPHRFRVDESGWFLVRAIADVPNTFRFASTAPWYVEVGGRPMIPRRDSAQFFVDWCRERRAKIGAVPEITAAQKEELLQPWREAEAFWQARLAQASGK